LRGIQKCITLFGKGGSVDDRKPKLRWSQEADGFILLKHRVRWEVLDALLDAEDLSLVDRGFGRLMLQGTVKGKCYRLVAGVLDGKEWVLEPLTGYCYPPGDPKNGGVK
jgi:hypothetical protein